VLDDKIRMDVRDKNLFIAFPFGVAPDWTRNPSSEGA